MENVPINTFGAKRRKEPESTISVQQNIGQQVAPNMSQEDDNQPSTSREAIVRRKRAEYMRMYRQRQKQKRLDEINAREQEQQLEVEAQQISAQEQMREQRPQQIQLQRPIQEQSQLQQQSQLRHFQQQQSAQSQQQQKQHQLQQPISQQQPIQSQQPQYVETADVPNIPYAINHTAAHKEFKTKFINNNFGHSCSVCHRLWYDNDLKAVPLVSRNLVRVEVPDIDFQNARVCGTCHVTLNRNKIPQLSSSNGFKYPPRPLHLPQLDIITERLVSPRLPFMQIGRLRHGQGQYGIFLHKL